MGHAALKQPSHMTVNEFLAWDDGADTRYELVGGEVFAMAPPSPGHGLVAFNLIGEVSSRLKSPCKGFSEVGVRLVNRDDTYYQADLVVSCAPVRVDASHVSGPVVIVEVLSPSTSAHDRGIKLPDYRAIPSVQEIALVSSTEIKAEIWRRTSEGWAVTDVRGEDAALCFQSLDVEVPLAAIYAGMAFEPELTEKAG